MLLALCATSMCAGVAYAQVPPTLGPADGNAAYTTPSTDKYWRVDDATNNAAHANIVYQTIGTKSTYWVAPSIFQHSLLDHSKAAHTTGLNAQWKWEVDASTPLTVGNEEFKFGTYVQGTPRQQTSLEVEAVAEKEMILKVSEVGDCGDGLATLFKIIATGKPNIEIESASVIYGAAPTDKIDGVSETASGTVTPAAIQGAKGFVIKTCDATKLTGKKLQIKMKSTESGVPDDLRRYAFSVKHMSQQHDAGGTYTETLAATAEKEYKLASANAAEKKFSIPTAGSVIEFDNLAALTLRAGDDYAEHVYYLDGSEGRTKLVSMVSHRSSMTAPETVGTLAEYDFDKTGKGFYVVVRLMATPKTGPVYFIPYID